jgi:ABC-2 type transport system ATP-binding protein
MLVEASNIAVTIGGVPILKDVSLSLAPGEIYGLLGPNGAGKTTTMLVLSGLVRPDRGRVRVLGLDPAQSADQIHRNLGFMPEQNGFYGWMTAAEYLDFFSSLYSRPINVVEAERRMDAVGLAPRKHQSIDTFSRGMRQRLGLARALIVDPSLLILDEPTNGLDPEGRREIHDILVRLSREEGKGVLLCTHLLDDVERLCDRIGVIVAGATKAEGTIQDLVQSTSTPNCFLLRLNGEPPLDNQASQDIAASKRQDNWWEVKLNAADRPDAVWRRLLNNGWPIVEVRQGDAQIESLYFTLTGASHHDTATAARS